MTSNDLSVILINLWLYPPPNMFFGKLVHVSFYINLN